MRCYAVPVGHSIVLVDQEDYDWFRQWRWHLKASRGGKKWYAYHPRTPSGSIYLHVEVMRRTGREPPTADHVVAHHANGDSLDCRRCNLRWATRSGNRRNVR